MENYLLCCWQRSSAEAGYVTLQQEVADLRRSLKHANLTLQSSQQDLTLMTRENQALSAELGQVSAERDREQARLADAKRAQVRADVALRELQTEKDALLLSYKNLLADRRKDNMDRQTLRHLNNYKNEAIY